MLLVIGARADLHLPTSIQLLDELFVVVGYDGQLIWQWLRDYEDFEEVLAHYCGSWAGTTEVGTRGCRREDIAELFGNVYEQLLLDEDSYDTEFRSAMRAFVEENKEL